MFNLFWWWFSFEVTLLYFALDNYFFYSIQVFFQFRFMLHIYIYIHIYIRNLDNLHTLFLLSYIFILYSPQTFEWWIERHNFCGACCSYTSSANKLFLEWNASATICSWTVRHVTAVIAFLYFTPVVSTVWKQQHCQS